ncbi:MAG: hypothetical protein JXR76_20780 [Deltaproteobacteria bacterium]|nr:hypothetical protein [Deltaproteobacteria bacterium]
MLARFMEDIVNIILIRHFRLKRLATKLKNHVGGEATEEGLKLLLRCMALALCVDNEYRKNLKDFNGRYLFTTKKGPVNVAATCANNKMSVYEKSISDFDVRVDFSDYKAIIDFLIQADVDIIDQMLNQKLSFFGNLNYLYKLGYMTRHLMLKLGIAVS